MKKIRSAVAIAASLALLGACGRFGVEVSNAEAPNPFIMR